MLNLFFSMAMLTGLLFSGIRRQERAPSIPSEQLPKHDASEALHLHDAHATRRRLESNPIQLVRFHAKSLRNELHWNAQSSGIQLILISVSSLNLVFLPTFLTIWLCSVYRSTPTAASGVCTSQTDSIQKTSYRQSSNCIYPYNRPRNETAASSSCPVLVNCTAS